jgi:membrane protein implicated in regulation of membrane protease activity
MKRLVTRLVGDSVIIGAWIAFVAAFLLVLAPGWAWWAQGIVIVLSTVAGCAIGNTWASRWKTPGLAEPASRAT